MRRSTKIKGVMLILILGSALCLPAISMAGSILGGSLIVEHTGTVSVTFQGHSASYSSTLFLHNTGQTLFNNKTASVGQTIELVGTFVAGTELVFGLTVHDTGHTFYTGIGARNADGLAHALLDNTFGADGETLVSFEDLLGGDKGYDEDYNDHEYSFTNLAAEEGLETDIDGETLVQPEPSTIILLGSGLLGLGAWRWKKKGTMK